MSSGSLQLALSVDRSLNYTYEFRPSLDNTYLRYISNESRYLRIECLSVGNMSNVTININCQSQTNNTCPGTVTNLRILSLNLSQEFQYNYTCISNTNNITVELALGYQPIIYKSNDSALFVAENDTLVLQVEVYSLPQSTLQWNFSSLVGFNGSTTRNVLLIDSFSGELEGSYTVVANNTLGSTNATYQVRLGQTPIISPSNDSVLFVAESQVLVLQVSVSSLHEYSVRWNFNSIAAFNGETNETVLIIYNFTNERAGYYAVVATNRFGSVSFSFNVSLGSGPIISRGESILYAREYLAVSLLVEICSTPLPSSVTWFFNSKVINQSSIDYAFSISNANLTIRNITRNLTGIYTIRVVNQFNQTNSSFEVRIGNIPVSTVKNTNLTYVTNSSVTLECKLTADPPVQDLMWFFNTTQLSDSRYKINNNSLTIPSVQLSDAGVYTCKPANLYGSTSIQFNLVIHSLPQFIPTGATRNVTRQDNRSFNITCIAEGTPTPRIEWLFNNILLTDGIEVKNEMTRTISTLTIDTAENATYTCRAASNITTSPGNIVLYYIYHNYTVLVILPIHTPYVPPALRHLAQSFIFTSLFCLALLVLACLAVALAIACLLQERFRTVKIVELNPNTELGENMEMTIIHPTDKFQTLVPKEYAMIDSLSESGIVMDTKVREISNYIESLKANDILGFSDQYEQIRRLSDEHSSSNGEMQVNRSKNRYNNIFCFDHSRVKLTPLDDTHNDFIHANFISGFNSDKEYIAAQGPLENTVNDFWRMIWEYRCCTIVMLTKCMENLKRKCAMYWVEEGRTVFFQIAVTHTSSLHLVDYSVIKLSIIPVDYTGEKLEISLFQFVSWPDFGTPDSPAPLLHFRNKVREHHPYHATNPMVVHCSAGVGRSGTFISLDIELQRAAMEDKINPFTRVLDLRKDRNFMVQTESQYIFLHDAILEGILFGYEDTPVSELPLLIENLYKLDEEASKSGFELDFKALTSGKIDTRQFSDGNLPVNFAKNRTTQIIPFNKNRVKLTMIPGVDGSDYINASMIDSYAFRNVFIATQAPMDSTICDFWRMVFERNVQTIIMLCSLREHNIDVCAKYWPDQGDILDLEPVTITNEGESQTEDLMIFERDLKVEYKKLKSSRTIKHYNFLGWYDNRFPEDLNGLLELLDIANERNSEDKRAPIVVHCTAGVGRTGVFLALYNSIEQATFEECVNPFYVIKKLRLQRIHTVQSQQQYEFSYQALVECLRAIEEKDV